MLTMLVPTLPKEAQRVLWSPGWNLEESRTGGEMSLLLYGRAHLAIHGDAIHVSVLDAPHRDCVRCSEVSYPDR
jgi:hypothetical protein